MIDRRRFFQLTAAIAALTTKLADRELEDEPEEVELHTSGTPSASGFWAP